MEMISFVSAFVFLGIGLRIIRASSETPPPAASGVGGGGGGGQPEEVSEYCQWEYFNASCSDPSDVVLMRSAFYGRMRFGRCVQENHGAVGCGADVLPYLDRRCSGRKSCQLTIPDATLHNIHPCPKELMPYLEASYSCIKVTWWTNRICRPDPETPAETTDSGLLLPFASAAELQSHPDSSAAAAVDRPCPWVVRTRPGQRINLTLFSFAASASPPGTENGGDVAAAAAAAAAAPPPLPPHGGACALKILIVDRNRNSTAELCADGQRQKRVYSSRGNLLKVYVQPTMDGKDAAAVPGRFLLTYQAFDCADVSHLSNAWIRRSDDKMVVRCNFTAETFFLTCRNSRWVGELHNCTDGGYVAGYHGSSLHTYGILAVIGLGVSLGVATAVVLLFSLIVFLRKRRRSKQCPIALPPTSHPLLSAATGGSDPLEVQSIYLPDCSSLHHHHHHHLHRHQTDQAGCPFDIYVHKHQHPLLQQHHHHQWEETAYSRDPSGRPTTRGSASTAGLPSTDETQSTATAAAAASPVSLDRGYRRSPVPRPPRDDDDDDVPGIDAASKRGSGSLVTLLAANNGGDEDETTTTTTTQLEGRYSDPGRRRRVPAETARTFDLVKDFARCFTDEFDPQNHCHHHPHHHHHQHHHQQQQHPDQLHITGSSPQPGDDSPCLQRLHRISPSAPTAVQTRISSLSAMTGDATGTAMSVT